MKKSHRISRKSAVFSAPGAGCAGEQNKTGRQPVLFPEKGGSFCRKHCHVHLDALPVFHPFGQVVGGGLLAGIGAQLPGLLVAEKGGLADGVGCAVEPDGLVRRGNHRAQGLTGDLRHFAEDHEGVVNGAMLYDRHLMQALFQLQIGNPGSSFAVEIARKIGLPEDVIADASEIVGSEYINADKYLQDIVRDKRYWEGKRQTIRQREKHMEDTIARYQTEMEELQKSRKEIIRQAKEEAERMLQESNARIENTIRTIKEAQAEKEKTRLARQELTDFRTSLDALASKEQEEKLARKMEKLKEKQERKKNKKNEPKAANAPTIIVPKVTPIGIGENVKIKGQTSVGQVMEINGKNAIVAFGSIKTTVKIDRLERSNAPQKTEGIAKSTFVSSQTHDQMYEKKLSFKQDIDVRGPMRLSSINYPLYVLKTECKEDF